MINKNALEEINKITVQLIEKFSPDKIILFSLRFNDWLEKARRDLKSAVVLKENDCGNDMVAFHCQQAIEKALKGYLLKNIGELVGGHSLVYLCKEANKFNAEFKNLLKDCAFVSQYYIETRYPADSPLIVSDEEADECIEIVRRILEFFERKINMALENQRFYKVFL